MEERKTNVMKTFDCDETDATSYTVSGSHLMKHAKAHKKPQQRKPDQNVSQSSDSFRSIILAGSGHCPSQKSSESSFYSAESTIITKKLPTSDCDDSSVRAIEDSSKNIIESSKEIENSSVASCSSNDALNKNIGIKCVAPTPTNSNTSTQSDVDLNKAQNLFKSTNRHYHDVNHNGDSAANTSNSIFDEENLHFLLGSHSTTDYSEIPQFLKSFSSLSKDETGETSKEVVRRLTRSFHQDPQEFANRLMTIIEESDTNYDSEKTAVSVNKMVSAYLKMCKYVEEESMPSMCDKISPARNEASQVAHIRLMQDTKIKNLLLQETSTPINASATQWRFGPKISPLSHKKNTASKIQSSPLYVSTLTRVAGPPKTPTTSKSPGSTPGSARSHNDSSFTFWEKKFHTIPDVKNNNIVPDITDEEKERIANAEKQLRILQAADSPYKSPVRTEINIYNIQCDMQKSPEQFPTSACTQSKHNANNSLDIQSDVSDNDITESIMYELAEKRKRCFETERTIRQIDAESSAYSNSPATSETEESDKILGFLNALRNCTDYQNYLKPNKVKSAHRHRDDSGIDTRSTSRTPRKNRSRTKQSTNKTSNNSTIAQDDRHLNVTMRRPNNAATPRKKSPTVRTSRISLSDKDVKSKHKSTYIKSPALTSRRVVSSNLTVRPISPIDGPSTSESSNKSASILQTPKSSCSSKPSVRTPRATSPSLTVWPPIKAKSREHGRARGPSSATKSSGSSASSTSNTINRQKSNTQLLKSDKGFTLEYLNSTSRARSPHIDNGKLSIATKQQCKKKYCIPTVCITNATPSTKNGKKDDQQQCGMLRGKNVATPTTSSTGRNAQGKFFNTPGKTPVPKMRPKPTTFFSVVGGVRKPVLKPQTLTEYFAPADIKSPVAEYVYGTDTTLVQNVRGKKNEYLLTPKKQNKMSDELKFKLAAKKNMGEKCKRNPIFDCEVDSISDSHDEHTSNNTYNHPKVSYQMPSAVHEIKASVNTPRGARAKRLMEAKDSRVVIQHAGRAMPRIRSVERLDMSIHVAKSAEKKKFVFQSNDTEQQ